MLSPSIFRIALTLCIALLLFTSSVQIQHGQGFTGCSLVAGSPLPGTPMAGNLNQPIDSALLIDGAELGRQLRVDPAIFYMQENGGPNASAMWARFQDLLNAEGRPNCCADGAVLIGLKLLNSEWRNTYGTGLSIPAVLAHEFTHIAQFKYNAPLHGKWRELHADYVAGWFIAHRGRFTPANNPYQAMANFFYKGDYVFNESVHHGTPQERSDAFRAGFDLNVRFNVASGMTAYQTGLEYFKLRGAY